MPTALITGVSGQDGSYLAEFLLRKGYQVVGTTRHLPIDQRRILHIRHEIEVAETDLLDQHLMEEILRTYKPDEIYNLAARASSRDLWEQPVLTSDLNGLSVTRMLEAIREVGLRARFCQASSSEVFGDAAEWPQSESTPLRPRNPYGAAKAYGHWIVANYRRRLGLFACSAILYNHESPRRSQEFVSRKISHSAAEAKLGISRKLTLGNLDARRDWGYAGEYVEAMWLMLQQRVPDDYVVATGRAHSVRELCQIAFGYVGLDFRDYVVEEGGALRDAETTVLVGNPAKAQTVLGWRARVSLSELVRRMVDFDLSLSPGARGVTEMTSAGS